MHASARPNVIAELQERIHRLEHSAHQVVKARGVSTGFAALDGLLGEGLQKGTLIEWLGEGEGSGAAALALTVAGHVMRRDGLFVAIDPASEFYPTTAAALGIPLGRTVVVRPETRMSTLWAWEQSLRCAGVAVTFGWMETIGDRLFRRLQLAVEAGGGLGFLLRPAECRAAPSWGATRIGVKPRAEREVHRRPHAPREVSGRRLQVRLIRGPCGTRDTVIEVELSDELGELSDETSDVHLVSELADPATAGRAAL
jgi:protein ImuA